MLIKCPECKLQISTKAAFCPHCGYVVADKPIRVSSRRKRLPNGFGQISEIKGRNLRNPYRVMVPAGKDENGRPISKLLSPKAYFKSYNEAYTALVEYNKSPYNPSHDLTFEDLYEEWLEYQKQKVKSQTTLKGYRMSFNHLAPVHKYKMSQIRAHHIRDTIESSSGSNNIKMGMKNVCNMMYDYAVEREIVQRNFAREIKLNLTAAKPSEIHSNYSLDEIKLLWENINNNAVFAQLLQCYTGFRPQEVLLIKITDVDLDLMTIKGGMKTEAGTNRIVPIHPMLDGLILQKYKQAKEKENVYLVNNIGRSTDKNEPVKYESYTFAIEKFWKKRGTRHLPHDGRVHFITTAKKYNLNEYAIKRIVGHRIDDLTERVYTKRDLEWFKSEILKIPPGEFFIPKIEIDCENC